MRIAILTLPLHTNYGGILQAYALQTILERMGHKVEVLDKRRKEKSTLPLDVKIKRFILKYILFRKINPLREDIIYQRRKIENKHTWKFADKYIHRREISSFSEIKEGEYDAIVVGSDQVWRPCYFSGNYHKPMQTAFLDFTEKWNIKRISYAASLGCDEWEFSDKETFDCRSLISRFTAVSVREEDGKYLIINNLNFERVTVMPDPTLLLCKEDYINLFTTFNLPKSKGNLLVYFLDETEDKNILIRKVALEKNLTPFQTNVPEKDMKVLTQPKVECWLRGFHDANLIVTDSFHACIFSIIFKKDFIVYGNKDRGISRIKNLLSTFELEDRFIENSTKFQFKNIKSSVQNNNKINQLRTSGLFFLRENLK